MQKPLYIILSSFATYVLFPFNTACICLFHTHITSWFEPMTELITYSLKAAAGSSSECPCLAVGRGRSVDQ